MTIERDRQSSEPRKDGAAMVEMTKEQAKLAKKWSILVKKERELEESRETMDHEQYMESCVVMKALLLGEQALYDQAKRAWGKQTAENISGSAVAEVYGRG
jgi:hypothetical protein